ncbi:MAG: PAS domain-containing sensor histidine kinase [Gemmatimonadales bacterium]|nr:MAG: PAS domain-containing sensor histidine kinase [Gemmatimonadales bacterium]
MDPTSPRSPRRNHAAGVPWRFVALACIVLGGVGVGALNWMPDRTPVETEGTGVREHDFHLALATTEQADRRNADRRASSGWGGGLLLAGTLALGLLVVGIHLLRVHARIDDLQLESERWGRDRAVLRELRQRLQKAASTSEILDAALSATETCLRASEVRALLSPDLRRRLRTPGRRIRLGACTDLSPAMEEEERDAVDRAPSLPPRPTDPVAISLANPDPSGSGSLGVLLARCPAGETGSEERAWVLEQIGHLVGAALAGRVALVEFEASQDRFADLFDALPSPIFASTSDGRLLRTNVAFRRLFALSDEGESDSADLRLADLLEGGDASAPLRLPGSPGDPDPVALPETRRFRTREGRAFMGELSLSPHDPGGAEGRSVLGSVRDLSQQLGALADSRTLSQALLQLDAALCIADQSGRVRFANPAFEAMVEVDSTALYGRFFDDPSLSFQELTGSARRLLDRVLAGEIVRGERTVFRRGEERLEARTITPIRSAEGAVTHIVSLSRDITADRSLEQQFHRAQKLDAVGHLAGGVAHDFNNLLTVIQGHVHMILARLDAGDPVREDLEGMMQASSRAGALVQQLLTFSKESPELPSALDVAAVLEETESLLRRLLPGHVQLRARILGTLPEVAMSQSHLEQVLVNLVVNARDAMRAGGVIDLVARAEPGSTPSDRQALCLEVKDSGPGIPPEVRERMFEPFFTTKEKGKGSGLGLSTVYGIVTRAGGSIEVASKVGKGATFTIRLPGSGPEGQGERPAASRSRKNEAGGRTWRGDERILLVEDHDLVRGVTVSILKDHGYAVDEAISAEDAIRILQTDGPLPVHDLVITDLVMPGLGGAHLAQYLRCRIEDFPVLFISGYRGMDDLEPLEIPGRPIAMVGKPFTVLELVQAVRVALEAPREAESQVGTPG